jgi:hypothetical protein
VKSAKYNFLIKTVYAYIDLIYKVFPFFFLVIFLPLLFTFLVHKSIWLSSMDVFRLFDAHNEFIRQNTTSFTLVSLVIGFNLVVFIFVFITLKKLRDFIKSVFEGMPFCWDNGKRLKFAGLVISAFVITKHLLTITIASVMLDSVSTTISLLISIAGIISVVFNPYLILGLFVVILGEIIIHGAQLKEENDLTV